MRTAWLVAAFAVVAFAGAVAAWAGAAGDSAQATPDNTVRTPGAPVPVSPTGPAPARSYATELLDEDETMSPDGQYAVASTAPGTYALTGVLVDDTGPPIAGATVYLRVTSCAPTFCACPPKAGLEISTTSDASGGFAFIDVPVNAPSYFSVAAAGYESFEIYERFSPDETYHAAWEIPPGAKNMPMASDLTVDDVPPGARSKERECD